MSKTISFKGVEYSENDLVDYKVAAIITGLSERSIQDLSARRKLPMYKVRALNRYKVSELLTWIKDKKVGE